MNVPTPKFSIGANVWLATTRHEVVLDQCPDCLNTGKWAVEMPSGEKLSVDCSSCDGKGIKRWLYAPACRPLTIGSIRIDTNDSNRDEGPVSYMCEETGVGSGSIWYEPMLFPSRDAALEHAKLLAVKANIAAEQNTMVNLTQARARKGKCATLGTLKAQRRQYQQHIEYLDRHIASFATKEA